MLGPILIFLSCSRSLCAASDELVRLSVAQVERYEVLVVENQIRESHIIKEVVMQLSAPKALDWDFVQLEIEAPEFPKITYQTPTSGEQCSVDTQERYDPG